MPLLEVNNLFVTFSSRRGKLVAVNGVSFSIERGKTLALVGESGSGKSVTASCVLRLLDENGKIEGGEIWLSDGERRTDLLRLPEREMCAVRGARVSLVFQDPMTALNPVFKIGTQVAEVFRVHLGQSRKEAWENAVRMLKETQIPFPERVARAYPHQLSGGMRQRVVIAMALACRPELLVADEPTTALDVTVQAEILRLMGELKAKQGTAMLFITHDLSLVREVADDVAVMYCGEIVERVPARRIFENRALSHPYTDALLASVPSAEKAGKPLDAIGGNVPHPSELPTGCKFALRCKYRTERCDREAPPLFELGEGCSVRCFYPRKEERRVGKREE